MSFFAFFSPKSHLLLRSCVSFCLNHHLTSSQHLNSLIPFYRHFPVTSLFSTFEKKVTDSRLLTLFPDSCHLSPALTRLSLSRTNHRLNYSHLK